MDRRVQTVIDEMKGNLRVALTVSAMAKSVNLSPYHFCHKFKSKTGVPPKQYLRRLRMKEAKRLSETTFLSVKEIMTQVGAGDKSHFLRDFKKFFGYTPTQHRLHK